MTQKLDTSIIDTHWWWWWWWRCKNATGNCRI